MRIDVHIDWLYAYTELDLHRQLMEHSAHDGDWELWQEQEIELIRLEKELATYFN